MRGRDGRREVRREEGKEVYKEGEGRGRIESYLFLSLGDLSTMHYCNQTSSS